MPRPPLIILVVLDGWGLSDVKEGNAIAHAQLPNMEALYARYPWVALEASGPRVGLPTGQMGNSEVGHLNIGAGRVVRQDITRIDRAIESGDFFDNKAIRKVLESSRGNALHLLGLTSEGGVHSHLRHVLGLLRFAKRQGVERVFIHAFTDGRDASPTEGINCIRRLQEEASRIGVGRIASVSGRYYAMDRDNRWQRTEKAYRTIVEGLSETTYVDPLDGIASSYGASVTDEFVVPFAVVDEQGSPAGRLQPGHGVVFFNYRADRARQLTRALTFQDFDHFPRPEPPVSDFVTMTQYDRTFTLPNAFPPVRLEHIMVKLFTDHKLQNLRMAETEKYAHVTYFFNGGEEQLFEGEERILVPSPKVPTYDQQPEMSAYQITDRLLHELDKGCHDAVVLNFANADMVGHTGVMGATVKAAEAVDTCLGRIVEKTRRMGGVMMVTADHGNAEKMFDSETGAVHTAHTSNPVPFILVDDHCNSKLRSGSALEDISPTILHYLDIEKPAEMTGNSLLLVD